LITCLFNIFVVLLNKIWLVYNLNVKVIKGVTVVSNLFSFANNFLEDQLQQSSWLDAAENILFGIRQLESLLVQRCLKTGLPGKSPGESTGQIYLARSILMYLV